MICEQKPYNPNPSEFPEETQDLRKGARSLKKKTKPKDARQLYNTHHLDKCSTSKKIATDRPQQLLNTHLPSSDSCETQPPKTSKISLHEAQPRSRRKKRKTSTSSSSQTTSNNFSIRSIFKQPSSQILNKLSKQDIRLPTLDKKRSNFQDLNEFMENPEKRRVVKIPIQKLKPLHPDEVKRRFMMKYHLEVLKT